MGDVRTERAGAIARIVFDAPRARNALTVEMAEALSGALGVLSDDPAVRCIVVRGAGDHFCAGADLRAAAALVTQSKDQLEAHIRDRMHPAIAALAACPKPTLAVVRGACVGIGMSVAMACDLRLAATDSSLGLVFTRIGLHPDGGASFLLPRLVGLAKAMELMLLGDTFDGTEAERIGLVNRAVPPDDLEECASTWASRLAGGPPIAYRLLKANLHAGLAGTLAETLDREAHTQVACLTSGDAMRGVQAFFTQSKPRFEGD